MKKFLLLTSLVLMQDGLHGAISEYKTQYITIPGTAVLSCPYEKNPPLRWLQGTSIISQGSTIRPDFKGRFRVIKKPEDRQYELQILNTTEEDLGLYVCEAQLDSVIKTTVLLKLAVSEENFTQFVAEEKSTVYYYTGDSCAIMSIRKMATISEIKTQYITIPGTAVLSCQYEHLPNLRWRKRGSIISQGPNINPAVNGSERFRATNNLQDRQYELKISKNNRRRPWFIYFIISTEENIMSTIFVDNEKSTTFISEDNFATFVSEEKSTELTYRETTSEKQSTTSNKGDGEENTKEDTGLSFRDKFFYGLLAAGLALVLVLSVLCNLCINRKCKKESRPIMKESPTSPLQKMEENVLNDNQRISLVEMDEISVYESINENQMLSNLALAMQSKGRTVACQLKRSQSTRSTSSSEKSYSEIADDNAYLNPYQPMKSDRESSNLHKYSTTSNTDKSLQKPQCDDVDEVTIANQNTSSTLLEADVVNLSHHESSSDDDTDGIIDKGDGYLHPYVPLMTNCMEYLHSYSSPINHDKLMKNNKSLTSSPCDDTDKVPIAEQKTQDSVGKENTMNLSDHESSESDGDSDVMCGNEDGYLHPYVSPMTNCMEYLHSYSTPIINEDQLMKTESSKLKDNVHCESVMNVTNDEDYTNGFSSNVISS